jgi:large subunit ribosomal protein L13
MKTLFVDTKKVVRKWYLIDAQDKVLGKVAEKAACLLRGKHKPEFSYHQEIGDYVIIINSERAVLTGSKPLDKKYYRHSGYPSGLSVENYTHAVKRKPVFPMEHAIRGMLPKGPLGRQLFRNVKVYSGSRHPHAAQKPEVVEV